MGASRAFRAYLAYLLDSSAAKPNLALAVFVPLLFVVFTTLTYSPSVADLMRALLLLTGTAYYVVTVAVAYAFTLDLSRGTCLAFLSQPLTRKGYVLAWMLAAVAVPALAYTLSFAVPLLVFDISLMAHSLWDLLLMFLEGVFLTMVVFTVGLLTRRPWAVVAVGLVVHLLLYVVVAIAYAIATTPTPSGAPSSYADLVASVYCLLYPMRARLAGVVSPLLGVENAALTAALAALSLEYARRRLEVGA